MRPRLVGMILPGCLPASVDLGDRVVDRGDGLKSAEIVGPGGRKRGTFALQVHGGQYVGVRFKDIEILPIGQGK